MPISFNKFRKKSFLLKVCCRSPKLSNIRGGEGDTFYEKKGSGQDKYPLITISVNLLIKVY